MATVAALPRADRLDYPDITCWPARLEAVAQSVLDTRAETFVISAALSALLAQLTEEVGR